jgi:hypothetical protein
VGAPLAGRGNLEGPEALSRSGLVIVIALLAAAGCGGGSSGSAASSRPLQQVSLTSADVATATGAAGVHAKPIDAALLRNPDPRGPCGARISIPDPSGGVATQFKQPGLTIYAITLSTPDGQHWIDQVRGDDKPGCGAYDTQVALRGAETVTPLGAIAVPAVGDDRVAYAARVSTSTDEVVGTFVLVRHGGLVTALTMFSGKPVAVATVRGLTQAAADALARGPAP